MSTDAHVTDLSDDADQRDDETHHNAGYEAGWSDGELHDKAGPVWEEQGPVWVSYAGLQARLYHLGWLGEELSGLLDRHEHGMRVEGLLSVITAECAAVARTALALAADPGPDSDSDSDDVPDPADDRADTDGPAAGRPMGGDAA